MPADTAFMDKLTALCKRRGFIYQSSEIYGGIGGFWDYGPMGVELKRNIKDRWWRDMVTNPPDGPDGKELEMVGVDCSIIMNPKVWEASGHATGFKDPMIECPSCKGRFREDFVLRHALFEVPDIPNVAPSIDQLVRELGGRIPAKVVLTLFDTDTETTKRALKKSLGVKKIDLVRRQAQGIRGSIWYIKADGKSYIDPQSFQSCPKDFLKIRQGEPCPNCGEPVLDPRQFNLMFETFVGALQDATSKAYLRPETAQGIFANFKNVLDTTRVKVPFGIAQVGKSFRNEINPRNFIFRSREFEQMEIEFFCHEPDSMKWYEFWRNVRHQWYVDLGLKSEKLRLRDQGHDELAHYSRACADIEYLFPFSDEHQELEGVAHRGNFDLTQHQKFSGKDLTYFDNDAWERDKEKFAGQPADEVKTVKNAPPYRFLPTVIEPSAGADRSTLAFLCEAYAEDQAPDEKGKMETRVVMRFHPKLAPRKVAIFPLVKKQGMPDIAEAIYRDVKQHLTADFDVQGSIGKRYRRQDEIGTPFCVTVDGQTLADGSVTIRDRDSLQQVRVKKEGVLDWLSERL